MFCAIELIGKKAATEAAEIVFKKFLLRFISLK